jgi:hypothetical protein
MGRRGTRKWSHCNKATTTVAGESSSFRCVATFSFARLLSEPLKIQQPTPRSLLPPSFRYDTKAQEPTHARTPTPTHPTSRSLPRSAPTAPAGGGLHGCRRPDATTTAASAAAPHCRAGSYASPSPFDFLASLFRPSCLIRPLRWFLDEQHCSRGGAAARGSSPRNSSELQRTGMGSRRLGPPCPAIFRPFRGLCSSCLFRGYEQRSRAHTVSSPF